MITDTDALTTAAWSIMILGHVPEGVTDGWPMPDLYLLTEIDIPWVDDGMRYYPDPEDRRRFMAACEQVLEGTGAPGRAGSAAAARRGWPRRSRRSRRWARPRRRARPRRPGSAATR